eukprot:225101-Chlamydomonas_euryale.AAC.4
MGVAVGVRATPGQPVHLVLLHTRAWWRPGVAGGLRATPGQRVLSRARAYVRSGNMAAHRCA